MTSAASARSISSSGPATISFQRAVGPIRPLLALRRLRDLDQVLVGIAKVNRADREARARADNRSLLDGDLLALEMRDDLVERAVGEKAHVERSRGRDARLDARLVTGRMHVELVVAEAQRDAVRAVILDCHAEHARVEVEAALEILRRDDDVIESADHP